MSHEFKTALTAVGLLVVWILLFLFHTRVVIPAVADADVRFSLGLATGVGFAGLAVLAWLFYLGVRRVLRVWRAR